VPEWYFLPFYAILRAVPANFVGEWVTAWMGFVLIEAKLAGVLAMFGSIAVLFVLPWLDRSPVRSSRFRPLYKWFFLIFLIVCCVLGYVGAKPAEGIYIVIGRIATVWYFAHFLVIIPLLAKFEKTKELPKSISEPVLGGGGGGAVGAAAKPMGKA
jgi:quinol-cytochrome oxidoreductase complex cytochrome b subunit